MRLYSRELKKGKKMKSGRTSKIVWCYDVHIEGKRKRVCGFEKKSEAREAAEELLSSVRQGLDISKESTFNDYYRQWVTAEKKGKITKSAFQTYINALNQFITYFGEDKKLATLERMEYRNFINWYAETHAQESVRKVNNCLKAALNDAQYDGYIIKNPAYNITFEAQLATQSEDVKTVSKAEFLRLKDYFKSKNNKSALLLYILIITGARFSEINNLKYIDIKNNGINISGGKTKNAKRFISVPNSDIEHIRTTLDKHTKKIHGDAFNLSNNAVIKSLDLAIDKCNISKRITPHALRHTHCSVLLGEGISINYISKRLGHASIAITQQVYSHLLEEYYEIEDNQTINFLKSI